MKRIKIALAVSAVVGAVSFNALGSGLAVGGASGYPYGNSWQYYTINTNNSVTFGSSRAFAVNVPIDPTNYSRWYTAGVNLTGASEASAWVLNTIGQATYSQSMATSGNANASVYVTSPDETLMIRVTGGSGPNSTTVYSAYAY